MIEKLERHTRVEKGLTQDIKISCPPRLKGNEMKRIGKFEIDVFKHGVELYIGLPPEAQTTTEAYCELIDGEQLIKIYLKDKNAYVGYIMHECVHAADFILNNIGANMGTDPDQSEIRAYLTEYIYCKVGWVLGTIKYDPTLCIHKKDNK